MLSVSSFQVQTCKAEDRLWCQTTKNASRVYMFVVDGHGGRRAADLACAVLSEVITARMDSDDPKDVCRIAIGEAASVLHEEVSGCVVTVCAVSQHEVVCANVGDASAWLIPCTADPCRLSASHAFYESPHERERVSHSFILAPARDDGGRPRGPLRAWPGGLAMGRSLGDSDCPFALTTPFVGVTTINEPSFVVLGSDGLWDALSMKHITRHVRQQRSTERLVRRAWTMRQMDDISAIIVAINIQTPPRRRLLGLFSESNSSISSGAGSDEDVVSPTRIAVPV